MYLSIISPVFKAEKILPELVKQITKTATEIAENDYEIILVEDSGPDDSRKIINSLCEKDKHVKGIFLSRNFGQQYAINAGLDYSRGKWVVTMDCDLQDTPESIKVLYSRAQEGYDIVYASRQQRHDNWLKKTESKIFNRVISYLTGVKQDSSIANFVLYRRKAVNAMKSMKDYSRYYPLMNHWIGFRQYTQPVMHAHRADNQKSSYTLKKRIKLAFQTIISFSDKPLRLLLGLGFLIVGVSIVAAISLIINYFINNTDVKGWPALFISIWFIAGIIIILLGLIGLYVGKIYGTVKNRPAYIVQETINI